MQEYYKVLGLDENASFEEVETAYKTLKTKYSKDRFLEGEEGNEAARKLTKIEEAYAEIKLSVNEENANNKNVSFSAIENCIKNDDLDGAQELLDNNFDRGAEWHYLQSVVFYKKNWTNESKKQLEIAVDMEPTNSKYKEELAKLNLKINRTEEKFNSGNANYQTEDPNQSQMGGSNCSAFADCCTTSCCMNMLCNACCR